MTDAAPVDLRDPDVVALLFSLLEEPASLWELALEIGGGQDEAKFSKAREIVGRLADAGALSYFWETGPAEDLQPVGAQRAQRIIADASSWKPPRPGEGGLRLAGNEKAEAWYLEGERLTGWRRSKGF